MNTIINKVDVYDIYIRKSRMDIELEKFGDNKTLERHEMTLTRLARERRYAIGNIYKEIVSGESLASRPEMQKLLKRVESGAIRGVIVMEIERLARGDTEDQGIVYKTFKYSNVLIVTPMKVYDLNIEIDSEYVEFGLFMSRREYITTTRRLKTGMYTAKKEGKFVGSEAPYGWEMFKLKREKGYSLRPHSTEYQILKEAFNIFLNDKLGVINVCKVLNGKGYKTREGLDWSPESLYGIIKNPVHAGFIRINYNQREKYMKNGIVKSRLSTSRNIEIVEGRHKEYALITPEEYQQVLELLEARSPKVPFSHSLKNSLAGLVKCAKCGKTLQRRPYNRGYPTSFICKNPKCDNIGAPYDIVEAQIIKSLRMWLESYKIDYNVEMPKDNYIEKNEENIKSYKLEEKRLKKRQDKIYSFYEDGSYTSKMFQERINIVNKQLDDVIVKIDEAMNLLHKEKVLRENTKRFIPKVEKVIDLLESSLTPVDKNQLLKEVLVKVEYLKTVKTPRGGNPTNFTLKIYPNVPKLIN